MTDWTDIAETGSGQMAYALSIAGVGVYTTKSGWLADSDFSAADHKAWLDPLSPPIMDERINFLEGRLKVKAVNLRLVANNTLITEIKDWRVRGYGRLTSTLTAAATAANLDDTSWAETSGLAWIGGEVVSYVGKTASSFTSLTRALLGTEALDHEYDPANRKRPVVSDGPHTIVGRRATIIARPVEPDGSINAGGTIIYRGRIGNAVQVSPSQWTIAVEHISKVLEQEIGQEMPTTDVVQGYWYSGEAHSFSEIAVTEYNTASGANTTADVIVIEGLYKPGDLVAQLNARFNDLVSTPGLDLVPQVVLDSASGNYSLVIRDTQIKTSLNIWVREGDPLWALGFEVGQYAGRANTAESWEAETTPRLLAVDFAVGAETRPQIEVTDASELIEGLYVQLPGFGHMEIDSITGNIVDLIPESFTHEEMGSPVIALSDDEESMILRHVFVFHDEDIGVVLRSMLYLDVGQPEPKSWTARGSNSEDWNWTELEDALGSVPLIMRFWNDTVTKPIKVWDAIGPLLGALAIAPRITTNGRIGFERLRTPTDTIAETVEVDAEVWAAVEAKEATARLDDSPLVNVISVKHGYDYKKDDEGAWHDPIEIVWDDGLNTLGKQQPMTYQLRGIQDDHASHLQLAQNLNAQIGATHYGIFGRLATTVEIPCTWLAKQFKCGQIVKITHDLVPDLTEGAYGVTDRLGIIMGMRWSLTGRQADTLLVRIPPPTQAAGIAPCALATSFVGTSDLYFASTSLYSPTGVNDLSWFEVGDKVQLQEYDSTSGSRWDVTISQIVNLSYVVINTDLTGSFPSTGAYMTLPMYDTAAADQSTYAYHADAATIPSLGTAADDADEWAI